MNCLLCIYLIVCLTTCIYLYVICLYHCITYTFIDGTRLNKDFVQMFHRLEALWFTSGTKQSLCKSAAKGHTVFSFTSISDFIYTASLWVLLGCISMVAAASLIGTLTVIWQGYEVVICVLVWTVFALSNEKWNYCKTNMHDLVQHCVN